AGIEVRILLARIERLDACPFTNEAANSADGAGMFKHALGFGFENVILQDGAVFNLLPERFIRDGRPEEEAQAGRQFFRTEPHDAILLLRSALDEVERLGSHEKVRDERRHTTFKPFAGPE